MTLESMDKISLSDMRMSKAYEFLEDARANYQDGRHKTSVNRSYYAALNAVRAILILEGSNPETHEGAVTMLSLRFIRTKMLPLELIKEFKLLLSRRADVDYGDFETIEKADAEDSLMMAGKMIDQIDKARKKLRQELQESNP